MRGKKKDVYSLVAVVAFTEEGKEYSYYSIEDGTWEVAVFVGSYEECIAYQKSHPLGESNEQS